MAAIIKDASTMCRLDLNLFASDKELSSSGFIGRRCEARTRDKRIKSPLLYQLS